MQQRVNMYCDVHIYLIVNVDDKELIFKAKNFIALCYTLVRWNFFYRVEQFFLQSLIYIDNYNKTLLARKIVYPICARIIIFVVFRDIDQDRLFLSADSADSYSRLP